MTVHKTVFTAHLGTPLYYSQSMLSNLLITLYDPCFLLILMFNLRYWYLKTDLINLISYNLEFLLLLKAPPFLQRHIWWIPLCLHFWCCRGLENSEIPPELIFPSRATKLTRIPTSYLSSSNPSCRREAMLNFLTTSHRNHIPLVSRSPNGFPIISQMKQIWNRLGEEGNLQKSIPPGILSI